MICEAHFYPQRPLRSSSMSVFSAKDFNAQRYSTIRPTYPDSFYEVLSKYHQGPREMLIDVGCGPGTATFQLADCLNSFEKLIGTDLSSTMVENARATQEQNADKYANVSFVQSPAESFEFLGRNAYKQKCDMITAVECAHWFDFEKFQSAAAANLRAGGTLAIWGYGDFFFPDYPKLDFEIDDLTFGEDKFGPYWQQPGRNIACEMLKDLHYDSRWFSDAEEVYYYKEDLKGKGPKSTPLFMYKRLTLTDLKEYIKTWSGYHSWQKDHPKPEKDITDIFIERVKELYPELKDESEVQITWRTFWMFARRKP